MTEMRLVEALARRMCIEAGNDPDADVFRANMVLARMSGRADWFIAPYAGTLCKAWEVYLPEAETAAKIVKRCQTILADDAIFASYPQTIRTPKVNA